MKLTTAILLLITSLTSQAGFLWESNYDECVVNQLESQASASALPFIRNACEIKHPFERDVTDIVKAQGVEFKWYLQQGNYVTLTIKENNSKYRITKIVSEVGVQDYTHTGDRSNPDSASEFSILFDKKGKSGSARAVDYPYGKEPTSYPKYNYLKVITYFGVRVR